MEFKWWNQKTYDEIKEIYKNDNRCAICNATGTGKTSVIVQLIKDYVNLGNILVIAPKRAILDQYMQAKYEIQDLDNITYKTYTKIGHDHKNRVLEKEEFYNNLSLIVVDELHRTGAKTWMPAIQKIIEINPNAKILGASATPKRYDQRLQDEDMIDILFNSHSVGNFDLATCLKKAILPTPIYVSTMYSLKGEWGKLEEKAGKINDQNSQMEIMNMINESKINWKQSYNYDKIINQFLSFDDSDNSNTKILIFCKNIQHIKEIRSSFDPIFKKLYKDHDLAISEYHSRTSEKPFENFKDNNELGTVQILYSVEKFNEGLHIQNLKSIIMIRETESETIYYQQIGRILSLSGCQNPIIIDFVNNFNKIKSDDIWRELLSEKTNLDNIYKQRNEDGKTYRNIEVKFYNLTKDLIDIYNETEKRIIESYMYEYNGETGSIGYFANKYNKSFTTLYYKINLQNMTIREAILTSDDIINDEITYNGKTGTINDICKKFKKNPALIKYRLDHGKTIEEAMR